MCIRHAHRILAFVFSLLVSAIPPLSSALADGKCKDRCLIKLAVTTTFEDSGLSKVLLPEFTKDTGIEVKAVVAGTGEALTLAQRGDVDLVMVHAPDAEAEFIRQGHALERHDVMYNDFVLAGPQQDPAGLAIAKTASEALQKLYTSQKSIKTLFISRGDESGTHKKELSLWNVSGLSPKGKPFYRESGSGMGATLNIAADLNAYTLTDRGTWLKFKNKQNLTIVFSGDPGLRNQYGLLVLNPDNRQHINMQGAISFKKWILSSAGQQVIADYKINGEPAFIPNAHDDEKKSY